MEYTGGNAEATNQYAAAGSSRHTEIRQVDHDGDELSANSAVGSDSADENDRDQVPFPGEAETVGQSQWDDPPEAEDLENVDTREQQPIIESSECKDNDRYAVQRREPLAPIRASKIPSTMNRHMSRKIEELDELLREELPDYERIEADQAAANSVIFDPSGQENIHPGRPDFVEFDPSNMAQRQTTDWDDSMDQNLTSTEASTKEQAAKNFADCWGNIFDALVPPEDLEVSITRLVLQLKNILIAQRAFDGDTDDDHSSGPDDAQETDEKVGAGEGRSNSQDKTGRRSKVPSNGQQLIQDLNIMSEAHGEVCFTSLQSDYMLATLSSIWTNLQLVETEFQVSKSERVKRLIDEMSWHCSTVMCGVLWDTFAFEETNTATNAGRAQEQMIQDLAIKFLILFSNRANPKELFSHLSLVQACMRPVKESLFLVDIMLDLYTNLIDRLMNISKLGNFLVNMAQLVQPFVFRFEDSQLRFDVDPDSKAETLKLAGLSKSLVEKYFRICQRVAKERILKDRSDEGVEGTETVMGTETETETGIQTKTEAPSDPFLAEFVVYCILNVSEFVCKHGEALYATNQDVLSRSKKHGTTKAEERITQFIKASPLLESYRPLYCESMQLARDLGFYEWISFAIEYSQRAGMSFTSIGDALVAQAGLVLPTYHTDYPKHVQWKHHQIARVVYLMYMSELDNKESGAVVSLVSCLHPAYLFKLLLPHIIYFLGLEPGALMADAGLEMLESALLVLESSRCHFDKLTDLEDSWYEAHIGYRTISIRETVILLGRHAANHPNQQTRMRFYQAIQRIFQRIPSAYSRAFFKSTLLLHESHYSIPLISLLIADLKNDLRGAADRYEYEQICQVIVDSVLPRFLHPSKESRHIVDCTISVANVVLFMALRDDHYRNAIPESKVDHETRNERTNVIFCMARRRIGLIRQYVQIGICVLDSLIRNMELAQNLVRNDTRDSALYSVEGAAMCSNQAILALSIFREAMASESLRSCA